MRTLLRARDTTVKINPGAEEVSDDPVSGRLHASHSPPQGETFTEKAEPAPKNRKNPHQTGLFLIPLADAQVNPEHPQALS